MKAGCSCTKQVYFVYRVDKINLLIEMSQFAKIIESFLGFFHDLINGVICLIITKKIVQAVITLC